MKNLKTILLFAAGALLILSACEKEEIDKKEEKGEQSFKVRMTDNPGNYAKLDVEITSVAILNSNNEWVELNSNTQTVSVLELTNGEETEIASRTEIDADVYSKLKIDFSPNSELTLNSFLSGGPVNTLVNLSLSTSGQSQSVEIEIDQTVSAESNADLLVDFNVAKSILDSAGSYYLDPKITVIEDEKTGVQGEIENDTRAAVKFESETNSNVTYNAYTNEEGQFLVRGMASGNYTLIINPDMDEGQMLNDEYTITGVVIADGEITSMGEVQL